MCLRCGAFGMQWTARDAARVAPPGSPGFACPCVPRPTAQRNSTAPGGLNEFFDPFCRWGVDEAIKVFRLIEIPRQKNGPFSGAIEDLRLASVFENNRARHVSSHLYADSGPGGAQAGPL
jgi:hypothetical protein